MRTGLLSTTFLHVNAVKEHPMPESGHPQPVHPSGDQEILRSLRHDLRNALAPAMMTADLLSSHPDLQIRQRADTILNSLDSALKILKKTTSSQ